MIAIPKKSRDDVADSNWQKDFMKLLPRFQHQLKQAFCRLDAEACEEAVQAGTANCWQAYVRLRKQGRSHLAFVSSLARFAIRQVREGRLVGCRLNIREPLSRYAQQRKGIRIERLEHYDRETGGWVNAIIEYRRASVPDQVAMRIDFRAWFMSLPRRKRDLAADLAMGHTACEVASKFGLSAGRISQLRKELRHSWRRFHEKNEDLHGCSPEALSARPR